MELLNINRQLVKSLSDEILKGIIKKEHTVNPHQQMAMMFFANLPNECINLDLNHKGGQPDMLGGEV